MSVFNRSYRKYEGELKGRFFRIWSIAKSSFRVQYSGKKAIILSIVSNLPVLSFTLMLIFMAIFSPAGAFTSIFLRQFFGSLDSALYLIIMISFNSGSIFMPLVFIAAINSGIIANDRKHNSLALYMSKPIGRAEYILGKGISVFLISSFVTFIPWFVFMVAFTLLSGLTGNQFIDTIWVYFAALAAAAVINLFFGSIVLFFSSISKQSILAGVLTILVLFLPSIIVSTIAIILPEAYYLNYFSISTLITSAVFVIFGKPSSSSIFGGGDGITDFLGLNVNGYISLAILLGIALLFFLLTFRNLRKEDVSA